MTTTRTELEAAAFRRLVAHLRDRTDVQNIDLMNLAGFCRNCLANWMKEAADERGVAAFQGGQPRRISTACPTRTWKERHQARGHRSRNLRTLRNRSRGIKHALIQFVRFPGANAIDQRGYFYG